MHISRFSRESIISQQRRRENTPDYLALTLERCIRYDAITCGVYGEMVHTAYSDAKDSSSLYESMKKELQMFIDADFDDEEKRSDFYEVFVNRY